MRVPGFTSSSTAHALPHEQQESVGHGPGAYSPEKYDSMDKKSYNRWNAIGRAAFGTFGKARAAVGIGDFGDPGEYNPNHVGDIAVTSRASVSKSDKEGKGYFGAKSARVLRFEGTGFTPQTTPGPAAYKVEVDEKGREWQMSTMATGERMKSATFASTTAQRGDFLLPGAVDIPGPGAYTPNDAITIPHLPGANPDTNIVSKVGRASRYVADSMVSNNGAAGPEVGPGSYDPMVTTSGTLNSIEKQSDLQRDIGWTASFISGHLRELWHGWFGGAEESR